jgi:hypothetical protein
MIDLPITGAPDLTLASKKAAMKLTGVSESDRQWILDRLLPGQRAQVQLAYQQLQSLRGDEPLDFSAFFEAEEPGSAHRHPDRADFLVNQIAYESVQQALNMLSATYVAAFLRSDVWHEKSKYLSECEPEQRAQIDVVKQQTITPRSAQALADGVAGLAMNI